jgi:hypothetical protein
MMKKLLSVILSSQVGIKIILLQYSEDTHYNSDSFFISQTKVSPKALLIFAKINFNI